MGKNDEKIKELEAELKKTKYNKKTQFAIGLLKAKISRLKEKEEKRRSGGGKGQGYSVRKTGDATVIMVGFPSVGKSTLLNAITNAESPVGAYDFTTLNVIPGLLKYGSAKIQILDVPGVVRGAASGKGRGKEVLAVVGNADLIMIIVDVYFPAHYKAILKEIHDVHVRVNQEKPEVFIKKTPRGGIRVGTTVKLTKLTDDMVKAMLREFKIVNADVLIREDITPDQLIDVIEGNKLYTKAMIVVNKVDTATPEQIEKVKKELKPDIMISADKKEGTEELKKAIFNKLKFIRLYLKEARKKADMKEPLIMFEGCTIKDVCEKLHKDFVTKFKFARLWGKSAKFDGQKFMKLGKELHDKDILEIHLK